MHSDLKFDYLIYESASYALLAFFAALAVAPTLVHRSAGWLGIPSGVALTFVALFTFPDLDDLLLIGYVAGIAGFMGWRLPLLQALLAIPGGLAIGLAIGYLVPMAGAHNPIPFYLAACTLGFMIGAGASAITEYIRSRSIRKVQANG